MVVERARQRLREARGDEVPDAAPGAAADVGVRPGLVAEAPTIVVHPQVGGEGQRFGWGVFPQKTMGETVVNGAHDRVSQADANMSCRAVGNKALRPARLPGMCFQPSPRPSAGIYCAENCAPAQGVCDAVFVFEPGAQDAAVAEEGTVRFKVVARVRGWQPGGPPEKRFNCVARCTVCTHDLAAPPARCHAGRLPPLPPLPAPPPLPPLSPPPPHSRACLRSSTSGTGTTAACWPPLQTSPSSSWCRWGL